MQFGPDAKPQSKQQMVRISGARVLTGDTCASILQEREKKKQKEKDKKEKRKLFREQKKKEKEEELRKKKAAAAEKKATAAVKRAVGKAAAARKRSSANNDTVPTKSSEENQVTRKRQTSSYTLRDKRIRFDAVLDSDTPSSSAPVDADDTSVKDHSGLVWQCSICFGNYGEGDDEVWVQCGCGRWTYEVCQLV